MSSKSYFNEIAGQWDDMRKDFFSEKVREKAFAVADLKPGKIAADIGAGTGFITGGLLLNGLSVIAVDQSDDMLRTLKDKFSKADNIDCRVGEAEALPLQDGTADYAFANMYLHHVENPSAAIKEMVRILRHGGVLVITDLDAHNFEFLRKEQHDRWMGFKREDVADWFADAGLKDVKIDCVGQNCCADSCDGKSSAKISIFAAWGSVNSEQ
jgi:ubiquinone/menaquinone biosynthesis C-methylase UbiE